MKSVDEIAKRMSILVPKLMRSLRDPTLSRIDLTTSQIIILISLNDLKKCKVSRIAKERGVSMPTITGMIDRLVRNNHVKRQRSESDRRAVMVSLTKKGERVADDILRLIRKRWQGIAAKLTESERRTYIKILRKLARVVSEES